MSGWSIEQIDLIESMWRGGRSASDIASAIGKTRGAVMGKLHRLGLLGRRASTDRAADRPARAAPKPKKAAKLPYDPFLTAQIRAHHGPRASRVAIARQQELERRRTARRASYVPALEAVQAVDGCRYPIGDVQDPDFRFCCATPTVGRSYCADHEREVRAPADAQDIWAISLLHRAPARCAA